MADETTTTVDQEQRVLRRADMTAPGALTKFHERGIVSGDTIQMSTNRGGMRFENMLQVMEFAKMMALADIGVPKHLRGNPGACLRVALQADEWGFSPFAVADKSYNVSDRIAYESQLVHAVIERRAPLEGRLRMELRGEGPTRRCKVIGRLIGENAPFEWEGPEFQHIRVKNSPEWVSNPDKQLWYHASRDWARIYCPDVLLGVYTRDELDNTELGPSRARDVSGLESRMPETRTGGFDEQGIARTLAEATGQAEEKPEEKAQAEPEPARKAPKAEKQSSEYQPQDTAQKARKPLDPKLATEPTDRASYTAYAETWIEKVGSLDDAMARWDGERELRATCKVTVQERKRLEKLMQGRFTEGDDD